MSFLFKIKNFYIRNSKSVCHGYSLVVFEFEFKSFNCQLFLEISEGDSFIRETITD